MKRYLPYAIFTAIIFYLLWRAFPKAVQAREQRQQELDDALRSDATATPAGSGEDLTAAIDAATAA